MTSEEKLEDQTNGGEPERHWCHQEHAVDCRYFRGEYHETGQWCDACGQGYLQPKHEQCCRYQALIVGRRGDWSGKRNDGGRGRGQVACKQAFLMGGYRTNSSSPLPWPPFSFMWTEGIGTSKMEEGRGASFPSPAPPPFPQFSSVPHPRSLYRTHPRLSRFPNPRWRPGFLQRVFKIRLFYRPGGREKEEGRIRALFYPSFSLPTICYWDRMAVRRTEWRVTDRNPLARVQWSNPLCGSQVIGKEGDGSQYALSSFSA